MHKIITDSQEARLKLKAGVDRVANAVKITLGPAGRNAIIDREFLTPLITNDGITIAKEIKVQDPTEQLGIDVVNDALKSANDRAGDGTTTTTVLLQKIVEEAFGRLNVMDSLLKSSIDPMKIRAEIKDACVDVVKKLREQAHPISTIEDMAKVAKVSVESEDLGNKIAKMTHELGMDASISVEDGIGMDVEFDLTRGTKISAGFHSPHYQDEKGEYVAVKPYILVIDFPLLNPTQIQPIIQKIAESGRNNLIVLGEDFSKECLTTFTVNHSRSIFSVVALKVPVFHNREKLEDYAALTGATAIDESIKDISLEHLGTTDKVIITKDSALLLGCFGDVKQRIALLKEQKDKATSKFDQETLQKRINLLSGGVGIIRVGAQSESEREYLKLKIEDAVNATKWAMDGGVVRGGGLALKQVANEMPNNILTSALLAPYLQIQANAGGGLEIGEDILDPVKITITAIEKACSVAGILITTELAIAIKKDEKKPE